MKIYEIFVNRTASKLVVVTGLSDFNSKVLEKVYTNQQYFEFMFEISNSILKINK